MLKLIIIGYVWPEPNSSAAGWHMHSFIHLFRQQGWQVIFASPAALSEHRADLSALAVQEVSISVNDCTFDHWIKAEQPDIVLFDRFMMEEQFGWRVAQQCPQTLRLLDCEDLHSLRAARQQLLKNQLNQGITEPTLHHPPTCLYQQMSQQPITLREVAAILRCDLALIISDWEQNLLIDHFAVPASQLLHCPFMVDPAAQPNQPPYRERAHFVSIGNFRHAPNWDAVLWLKQQIWPLIRQQLPDAQLHVYGAYPPPKAHALHNLREGFLIKGWAADAQQVLAAARVLLAPLRFGAGIKGKLLDGMLAGTPSVTTSIGMEGMCQERAEWPGSIADQADGFARQAIALYQDASLWQTTQQRIAGLLSQHFKRAAIEQQLLARLQALRQPGALAAQRQSNFTGLMLRHHQHQSTRYMSQWIEAKNRLHALRTDADEPAG